MSKTEIITLIIIIVFALVILAFSMLNPDFASWLNFNWVDLVLAAILAIIAAVVIEFLYKKTSGKSNLSKTTMAQKPRKLLAKLVLPDNKEFTINQYERTFGREDFMGLLVMDDLMFIGKNHFRLTRLDDGFYIEDLDTKNGTDVNGDEITGRGKIKLKTNDEINVSKILTIKYIEQAT
jgi:hypothetical protein